MHGHGELRVAFVVVAALCAAGCGRASTSAPTAATSSAPAPAAPPPPEPHADRPRAERVGATFHHVDLHVADGIVLEIADLEGALVSTRPGEPPFLDDARTFSVDIEHADVAVSTA